MTLTQLKWQINFLFHSFFWSLEITIVNNYLDVHSLPFKHSSLHISIVSLKKISPLHFLLQFVRKTNERIKTKDGQNFSKSMDNYMRPLPDDSDIINYEQLEVPFLAGSSSLSFSLPLPLPLPPVLSIRIDCRGLKENFPGNTRSAAWLMVPLTRFKVIDPPTKRIALQTLFSSVSLEKKRLNRRVEPSEGR